MDRREIMKFEDFLSEGPQKQILNAIDQVENTGQKVVNDLKKLTTIIERELNKQGRQAQIKGQLVKSDKLMMDLKKITGSLKTFAGRIE
jgi:hypothetical protein